MNQTQVPSNDLTDKTVISGLELDFLRQKFTERAKKPHHAVKPTGDNGFSVRMKSGLVFLSEQEGTIAVTASSDRPDKLFKLKGTFSHIIESMSPEIFQELSWENAPEVGSLPPNFQFTTVMSVTPVGPFVRVRVKMPNLSFIDDTSIHFRVVLPPKGVKRPEWPYIDENGNSVAPKGEKALHRPVYTARKLYPETSEMEFDIFVHEGGRVTEWAQQIQPGERMAMIGRGGNGGGFLDVEKVIMFGDETAFPAIAHILDHLPATATGEVTLEADKGAECGYPISAPAGVTINWIKRTGNGELAVAALSQIEQYPDHFLWFAAETQDALKVREAQKKKGKTPGEAYVRAYWSRRKQAE
ncbi:hypothetical protein ACH42_11720 [Endozoicomonas sp. (ex Bugula neritina AB1)]|nr:hypothetical protein ACH42_11720 [Endozoicomonas sp. (ex Bugula neritina AB1)]